MGVETWFLTVRKNRMLRGWERWNLCDEDDKAAACFRTWHYAHAQMIACRYTKRYFTIFYFMISGHWITNTD
jgi:hypothetical protein